LQINDGKLENTAEGKEKGLLAVKANPSVAGVFPIGE